MEEQKVYALKRSKLLWFIIRYVITKWDCCALLRATVWFYYFFLCPPANNRLFVCA